MSAPFCDVFPKGPLGFFVHHIREPCSVEQDFQSFEWYLPGVAITLFLRISSNLQGDLLPNSFP